MAEIERLWLPMDDAIDIRKSDFDNWKIEGYASKFGNINSYREFVDEGAFEETIEERGPRLRDGLTGPETRSKIKYLWQHDTDEPMGIPMILKEDDIGLFHSTSIIDTPTNQERLQLIRHGVVDGFSIGFKTLDFRYDDEGFQHKTKIKLYEYSSVTFPADEHALVEYNRIVSERFGDDFGSEEFVKNLGADILMHFARRISNSPELVTLAIDFLTSMRTSSGVGDPPELNAGARTDDVPGGDGKVDPALVRDLEALGEDMALTLLDRKAHDRD